jgi:hypothetical protein
MSVLDDLTKDLPSNRGEALLVFADRVHDIQSKLDANSAAAITAFLKRFSSKYSLMKFDFLRSNYPNDVAFMSAHIDHVRRLRSEILSSSLEARIDEMLSEYEAKTEAETFGLARLNAEEKKKIHEHLARIRKILEESDLSDRKKNKLFERLNDLAREVDTQGTLTDRFFAFAGDVGFVLGDMTTKAKPLLQEVKEMLRIVTRSRARQEGISLPPGDEVLSLPSLADTDEE